ncbi:hypothetical protein MSAN_02361800 [Mycena sanguinolenta]|uniref:Uncharacterized protein n=1 Tax=Mycena sanguinolenta TaxID=230812 RepID=A0A8H7CF16_9AGAR|nr:hypothetical protein MSAN_02361800 [Mycena sanguinolenta]
MSSTPVYPLFPPRTQCLDLECQGCAGFIYQLPNSQAYSQQPDEPKRKCLCGHYYLAHYHVPQPDPHNPVPLRSPHRALGCGGFFKMQQVVQFNPHEKCDFCHTTWLLHDNVDLPIMQTAGSHSMSIASAPGFVNTSAPGFVNASAPSAPIPTSYPPSSRPPVLALSNNPFHSNPPSVNTPFSPLAAPSGSFNPFGLHRSSEAVDQPPSTVSDRSNPFARTSLPPPAAAFRDVCRPIAPFQECSDSTGNVQTLRKESIHRMHSSDPKLKASSPRRSRSIKAAGSSAITSSAPSLQDMGPIADAVPPPPGQKAYQICILPFKISDKPQYYRAGSPVFVEYRFSTLTALPELLRALTQYQLCTTVRIAHDKELWSQLNGHVEHTLQQNAIVLPPNPEHVDPEASAWELRRWELLGFRATDEAAKRKLTIHGLVGRKWTFAELHKVASRCVHPRFGHLDILFLAPRHGNLVGPRSKWDIDLHPCLPWRACWPILTRTQDDDKEAGCVSGCPDYDEDVNITIKRRADSVENFAAAEPKRLRSRSPDILDEFPPPSHLIWSPAAPPPPAQGTATQGGRGGHTDPIEIDSDSDSDVEEVEDAQDRLVRELISAESDPQGPGLSPDAMKLWRTDVYGELEEYSLAYLSMCGPTVESIARTLHALIRHIHEGKDTEDYEPSSPIVLQATSLLGFLHSARTYRVYSDPDRPEHSGATGSGPEQAVYVKGLALRLGDTQRWAASSSSYMRPSFYGVTGVVRPARVLDFQIDGSWIALFLVSVGMGPDPLCPFFLLAISQKDRSWMEGLTLPYIHSLDPVAARTLAPWFSLKRTDVVTPSLEKLHPGMEIALQYLEIPATDFRVPRDEDIHAAMHLNILCAQRGFNLAFRRKVLTAYCTMPSFKALVAGICNRRIQGIADITTRLQFRAPANFDKVEGLRREIFQLRFLRWIRGVGYPRSVRRKFVSVSEFKAQRKNKLLRAEAFLYSMTGMRIINPDPDFVFT